LNVSNDNGVRAVTRAEWDALLEQCKRVLGESAQARGDALQIRSEAVENRLLFARGRLERDEAALGERH
jgi:hypothetical protein